MTANDMDILVTYFSCTGNTEKIAEYTASYLNADIYEIVPEIPYTEDDLKYYTDCRADREQNDPTARPEISGSVKIWMIMKLYLSVILYGTDKRRK